MRLSQAGNVWEWVAADYWNVSYAGAPSDGSAWESGDCAKRVLRATRPPSATAIARGHADDLPDRRDDQDPGGPCGVSVRAANAAADPGGARKTR